MDIFRATPAPGVVGEREMRERPRDDYRSCGFVARFQDLARFSEGFIPEFEVPPQILSK